MLSRNKRRKYIVDPKFQKDFILRFTGVVVIASLAIGLAIIFFLRDSTTVAIENTKVVVKGTSDFILPVVTTTLLIVTFVSAFAVFGITLLASNRIAGPLFRLKKEIDSLKSGDLTGAFNVREKDELKDLAKSLGSMCSTLRQKHSELKTKSDSLKNYLKDKNFNLSGQDWPAFSKKLEEIGEILNYFKV
jgi:methyl-accepting chemotaxis protein